jgi:hypothetical protein
VAPLLENERDVSLLDGGSDVPPLEGENDDPPLEDEESVPTGLVGLPEASLPEDAVTVPRVGPVGLPDTKVDAPDVDCEMSKDELCEGVGPFDELEPAGIVPYGPHAYWPGILGALMGQRKLSEHTYKAGS